MRRLAWFLVAGMAGLVAGCTVNVNDPGSDLRANAGEDIEIDAGDSVTLSGSASGGVEPYQYRWSQNDGPTATIDNDTSATATTGALSQQGRYVFRLVVTDLNDDNDDDYVAVNVGPPVIEPGELFVAIDGPSSLQTLEPGTLEADVSNETGEVTYLWEIIAGEGELDITDQSTAVVTPSAGFSGKLRIRVTVTDEDDETASAEHEIDVTVGEFSLELIAPATGELGELTELTAQVMGAEGDVDYIWELVTGPTGTGLGQANCPSVWTTTTREGDVTVRVTVQDRETEETLGVDQATIAFELGEEDPFTITVNREPSISQPDEPVTLSVEVDGDVSNESFEWTVVSGEGTISDSAASSPIVTPTAVGTVHVRLDYTATGSGGEQTLTKDVYVTTIDTDQPEVTIEIADFGTLRVQLDPDAAPIAVANFLSYVDESFFDGLIIHRANPDDSNFAIGRIDGGGYFADYRRKPSHDRIVNEGDLPGALSNVRGTIMAVQELTGPDTAAATFLINVSDNSDVFDGSPGGFPGQTAFGTVIEGMDIVDQISEVETTVQCGDFDFEFAFGPVDTITITSVRRAPGSG